MHGTEVQRLLSPVYPSLRYRNARAILAVDPQTLRHHPLRYHSPQRREALGAEEIPCLDFLVHLTEALALPDRRGRWQFDIP